jgi:site-specific DNA-cytosine methylase
MFQVFILPKMEKYLRIFKKNLMKQDIIYKSFDFNSFDFGIPQNRKRVIIMGFKKGLNVE